MKEVRVLINDKLHKKVKSNAALQGKTISDVVRESLEKFAYTRSVDPADYDYGIGQIIAELDNKE